ncbi:p1 polyprotein [Lasius niger]|uniref:p1 polyprotein n=1 Tax=Lasius niger TaxID=67767 RepID=A0A0J7MKZ2_LASNI|nr:p1 polyprotein [Lasius niger]
MPYEERNPPPSLRLRFAGPRIGRRGDRGKRKQPYSVLMLCLAKGLWMTEEAGENSNPTELGMLLAPTRLKVQAYTWL